MIRVTGLPIGKDDGLRAKLADLRGQAQLMLAAGLDVGVGNLEAAGRKKLAFLARGERPR